MRKPKRIYILGTAGSGKSFLAKKLSEKLNVPCYDLDDIFWYKKYTKKRNKPERKRLLAKIASKREWIIEGVFGSWIEKALKRADLVVLLDIHIARLAWRILMRYLGKIWAKEHRLGDTIGLIRYAHRYKHGEHSSSYGQHMALLKKHRARYVVLKNNGQVKRFIDKI
jgi:adenylate kinase family enzyme